MRGFEPSEPLSLCENCVLMIANGECSDCHNERDHPCPTGKRLSRKWRGVNITLGCIECCDSEAERWFSWSACDGCGSLAGDREHATAWLPVRPVLARTAHITVRESPEWHWRTAEIEIGGRTRWFSGGGRYLRMATCKREYVSA